MSCCAFLKGINNLCPQEGSILDFSDSLNTFPIPIQLIMEINVHIRSKNVCTVFLEYILNYIVLYQHFTWQLTVCICIDQIQTNQMLLVYVSCVFTLHIFLEKMFFLKINYISPMNCDHEWFANSSSMTSRGLQSHIIHFSCFYLNKATKI